VTCQKNTPQPSDGRWDLPDKETVASVCEKLMVITDKQLQPIIDQIPVEWEVDLKMQKTWIDFLVCRAGFLSDNFSQILKL